MYSFTWRRTGPQAGYALALGDLDCDGTISTYRVDIKVVEGNIVEKFHEPTTD